MTEVSPAGRRVGFVLSGGGFRGAYQAGFLRAAQKLGYRPTVISGASVGALNAILYRHLTVDQLCRYWAFEARFRRMYRPRPLGIVCRVVTAVLLVPWLLLYMLLGDHEGPAGDRWSGAIADIDKGIRLGKLDLTVQGWMIVTGFVYIPALFCVVADKAVGGLPDTVFLILFPMALAGVLGAPRICRLLDKLGVVAFDSLISQRLTELAPNETAADAATPEIIVAVSRVMKLFDYSNTYFWQTRNAAYGPIQRGWQFDRGEVFPRARPALVPRYVRMGPNSIQSQLPYINATAALPLGLVARTR